jgi:hypothetical protein
MGATDYLNRLIPHRLDALAIAELMLMFRLRWSEPKAMQIAVDGRLQFTGLTTVFTNPIVEVGILNVRGLMEFVGLKASAGSLVPIDLRQRRKDDVGIEMFAAASGPLCLVTPSEIGAEHPEDPIGGQRAVAATIEAANKGLAHFTDAYPDHPVDVERVLLAFKLTQRIVERYLYQPLGIQRPEPPVRAVRRDG